MTGLSKGSKETVEGLLNFSSGISNLSAAPHAQRERNPECALVPMKPLAFPPCWRSELTFHLQLVQRQTCRCIQRPGLRADLKQQGITTFYIKAGSGALSVLFNMHGSHVCVFLSFPVLFSDSDPVFTSLHV